MAYSGPERFYNVISSDKEILRMSEKAIAQSTTLTSCIESSDLTAAEVEALPPIPAEKVAAKTLKLVIEWCEYHKNDPERSPLENSRHVEEVPGWDAKFLDIGNKGLFDMICAANFLHIPLLLAYACKMVANMVAGMTPDEMRKKLQIPREENVVTLKAEDEAKTLEALEAKEAEKQEAARQEAAKKEAAKKGSAKKGSAKK